MNFRQAFLSALAMIICALTLSACPNTSTGGPHHTPPTVIVYKP